MDDKFMNKEMLTIVFSSTAKSAQQLCRWCFSGTSDQMYVSVIVGQSRSELPGVGSVTLKFNGKVTNQISVNNWKFHFQIYDTNPFGEHKVSQKQQ